MKMDRSPGFLAVAGSELVRFIALPKEMAPPAPRVTVAGNCGRTVRWFSMRNRAPNHANGRRSARRPKKTRGPKPACRSFALPVLDRAMVRVLLRDLEDSLGLDDHLVLVEEVEALDEQLVAAALDVEDAHRGAGFRRRRGDARHQLALLRVVGDLVLRRLV